MYLWVFDIGITKSVIPLGPISYDSGMLTYTLVISTQPGVELNIYDLLTPMEFSSWVTAPPAGVVAQPGAITGTLTVTPTSMLTLTFVTQLDDPAATVRNRGCVYPLGMSTDSCIWSNTVSNRVIWPYNTFLPLVMRAY
jgi:hypothetical protein